MRNQNNKLATMAVRARHVMLLLRDVPASVDFYTKGLGLRVVGTATERWAELTDANPSSSFRLALKAVEG